MDITQPDSSSDKKDPLPPHDARSLLNLQSVVRCPITTSPVTTTMVPASWHALLRQHPDRDWAHRLVHDIIHGVDIGYRGSRRLKVVGPNFVNSGAESLAVTQSLTEEVALGRIIGPFAQPPFQHYRCSPLKTVEKKGQPGKFRIIHHLSHPHQQSINSSTLNWPCHLARFEQAANIVRKLGRGCYLAKIDIKAAYRAVPVRPADWPLLGMTWGNRYYFHSTLPFGLRSSCHLWERYATAAQWIANHHGPIEFILHYVDDFLIACKTRRECEQQLQRFLDLLCQLGLPIADNKTAGPSTHITFLGILIDTAAMTVSLDADRLEIIRSTLNTWVGRQTCSLRQLQSLLGILSWASMVVRHGRTFIQHMRDVAATYGQTQEVNDESQILLSTDFHADANWWLQFMADWNGISLLWDEQFTDTSDILQPHTDACSEGYAAIVGRQWFQQRWTAQQQSLAQDDSMTRDSMPWKELYAIVAAAATWGSQWARKKVIFWTDCQPVVQALQKGASRTRRMMQLIRALHYYAAKNSFVYNVKHIAGVHNAIADELSRVYDVSQLSPACRSAIDPSPIIPVLPHIPA